jgi:hypothetical protein
VNQRALARSDLSGAMRHLVRRDVVQHEADSLGGVQPGWHRNQFTLRQADELRVRTADRQRGNYLAWFDSRGTGAEPIPMTRVCLMDLFLPCRALELVRCNNYYMNFLFETSSRKYSKNGHGRKEKKALISRYAILSRRPFVLITTKRQVPITLEIFQALICESTLPTST